MGNDLLLMQRESAYTMANSKTLSETRVGDEKEQS